MLILAQVLNAKGGVLKALLPSILITETKIQDVLLSNFDTLTISRSTPRIYSYAKKPILYKQALAVFKKSDSKECVQFFSTTADVLHSKQELIVESLPHVASILAEDVNIFRSSMQSFKRLKQMIWLRGTHMAASFINLIESAFPSEQQHVLDDYRGVIVT